MESETDVDTNQPPPYNQPQPPPPYQPLSLQPPHQSNCDDPPPYPGSLVSGSLRDPQGQQLPIHHQQQQPSVSAVFITDTHQLTRLQDPAHQKSVDCYDSHVCLAFVVFSFCNGPVGLIAWILAVAAANSADRIEARRLGRASLVTSIAGVVITLTVVAIVLIVKYHT